MRGVKVTKRQNEITVWKPSDILTIPARSTPEEIVEFARPQLSSRDMKSIVSGLESESYEMVSAFVWTKASGVLKKQIASLGMEFVGEMLGRPDLDEDSDPAAIADHEALSLAEDLGIINSTQGIRLKHALELVSHFTRLEQQEAESDEMAEEEALMLLKTCISSILCKPTFETAIQFADFRKALGKRTLRDDDGDVVAIADSPYFFIRTTLSILLSLVKGAKGATQEHAVGNVSTLVPILWPKLREPEKWQIGQAYAEVNADGNREASTGIKRALLKVQGFDFVPESLRSNTFTETAARVLSAHFGFNNFYMEQEPIATLASLGTAIPRPAFAKCMEASLAVWLGNPWGHSYAAVPFSLKIFESLRSEQWEYYFNECLRRDRTVLDKMQDVRPLDRWIDLARKFAFDELSLRKSATVRKFAEASVEGGEEEIRRLAKKLRESATE
jgi:hypothetical protein